MIIYDIFARFKVEYWIICISCSNWSYTTFTQSVFYSDTNIKFIINGIFEIDMHQITLCHFQQPLNLFFYIFNFTYSYVFHSFSSPAQTWCSLIQVSRLFKFINIILYCTLNINFFNMLKSKGCQMHYIKRHSFFDISSIICFRWIHLNCEILRKVVLFKNVILSVVWNWHRNPVKFYFFSKVNSVEQNSIQRIYIIFVFCLIHAYDWRKTRLDFIFHLLILWFLPH